MPEYSNAETQRVVACVSGMHMYRGSLPIELGAASTDKEFAANLNEYKSSQL
jgi:hypothetical protein